jgi:macrolide-specific efflux system membrane fusion protein
MEVSASVTETDYPSLKVGQAVSVSITALGQTATGTVKEIDPIGTSSGSGGVVSYPIVVTIDPAPSGTASGMSADIEVTTAQADNVLSVPAAALTGTSGNYAVRVLGSDGLATSQPVQVGLVTSSLAEITSGVTEGQTVITGVNAPRTGTAATTTGGGGFGGGLGIPVGGGNFRGGGGNGN